MPQNDPGASNRSLSGFGFRFEVYGIALTIEVKFRFLGVSAFGSSEKHASKLRGIFASQPENGSEDSRFVSTSRVVWI